ncbi:tripartite tricarboxylate transporter substrate binding protein [Acuticoccus sp.]|uniref:tripartite tricarboxylate transporter substrate binding protein n=1 Tax=Acuticoccus sp. TaxID=1904378 RepID=UPI003B528909
MTIHRTAFAGLAGALALCLAPAASAQQDFPSDTIDVVIHAGPGGGTDITTRMMTTGATKVFGEDMQVVPKRGGSGAAALMYVDSQPRDGHTIMTLTQSHIFNILQEKVPLTIEDIVPLARATDDPMVIAVPTSSDIKTMDDLVEASNSTDGGLKWGTTFAGGADHVAIHTFTKEAGIPYTIVPFKGGGDIVTNLVGGNVDVALLNYAEGESQFNAGELKAIAALSEERIDALPDTPTAKEAGVDATASTVRGFVVLSGVPQDVVDTLSDGIVEGMSTPQYTNYLKSGGMPATSVVGQEEWGDHIMRIYEESQSALEELGLL